METAIDRKRREIVERNAAEETAKVQAEDAHNTELLKINFSQFEDIDKLYAPLSVADIKYLTANSSAFRTRIGEFENANTTPFAIAKKLIDYFRRLPDKAAQDLAYGQMRPEQKAIIDADFDAIIAQTDEERQLNPYPSLVENPPVIDAAAEAARLQAEADRLAQEAVANGVVPTVPKGSVEELYDGVEKIGEGSYKLTVDPGDGTPVEIFYGATQKDCFKALRKSKANATKELRRRAKKIQITQELKALQAEVLNYPPPVTPLALTDEQFFDLLEKSKDPSDRKAMLDAFAKLRQASLTQEECDRQNEAIDRQRYNDQFNTARTWMASHYDEFYQCDENVAAMQNLMSNLNWAVTIKNLDLAFQTLKEQGVLLDPPEDDASNQPPAQPASVVPVAAASVTPAALVVPAVAPSIAAPVKPAVAGGLPTPGRALRPGSSSSTGVIPEQRISSSVAPVIVSANQVLTVETYNRMPADEVKTRYQKEPAFRVQIDKLIAEGKI